MNRISSFLFSLSNIFCSLLSQTISDGAKFLASVKQHGAVLAGGLFPEVKYFRVGHMAYSVMSENTHGHLLRTLKAIELSLKENGHSLS